MLGGVGATMSQLSKIKVFPTGEHWPDCGHNARAVCQQCFDEQAAELVVLKALADRRLNDIGVLVSRLKLLKIDAEESHLMLQRGGVYRCVPVET